MNDNLIKAINILQDPTLGINEAQQAKEILASIDQKAGLSDVLSDPRLNTALTLLTPFVVNWKVNQVIKLLEDMKKDNKPKIDPFTGLRKFV
jgi:hypothetical protein